MQLVGRGDANEIDLFRANREAPEVMQAVRVYDPHLLIGWDPTPARWVILRVSRGGTHFVGVVETPDHQYRALDMSVLETLAQWDLWRQAKNAGEFCRQVEDAERYEKQRQVDNFNDDIQHATRDNRRTLNRLAKLAGF